MDHKNVNNKKKILCNLSVGSFSGLVGIQRRLAGQMQSFHDGSVGVGRLERQIGNVAGGIEPAAAESKDRRFIISQFNVNGDCLLFT